MIMHADTIHECKPGNMPEDLYPELFFILTKGIKALLCRIGNKPEDFEPIDYIELQRLHLIEYRYECKNKKRYTWRGEHPRFWSLIVTE